MGSLLYGKTIAQEIQQSVKMEIESIKQKTLVEPVIAIIKLDKKNSLRMAEFRLHADLAKQLGIQVEGMLLDYDTKVEELIELIEKCNRNPAIHGILVLLPLPEHIDHAAQEAVLAAISKQKELEGVQVEKSMETFYEGKQSNVLRALFAVMKQLGIDLTSSKSVFLSDDSTLSYNAVIRKVLQQANSLQLPFNSVAIQAEKASTITQEADLLAVSLQTPELIDAQYVKEGAIVIDFNPIYAGERFCEKKRETVPIIKSSLHVDSLLTKAKYVLPVLGGIGPVALANLMRNFLHNYRTAVLQ